MGNQFIALGGPLAQQAAVGRPVAAPGAPPFHPPEKSSEKRVFLPRVTRTLRYSTDVFHAPSPIRPGHSTFPGLLETVTSTGCTKSGLLCAKSFWTW